MKRIRWIALVIMMLLTACAESASASASAIVRNMAYRGYELPDAVEKQIVSDFTPDVLDCGEVQVAFKELLYDGRCLYTVASAKPLDPSATLLLPAGAELTDPVCGVHGESAGFDTRTYRDAAKEDGKRLVCVYAYPQEFDEGPDYILDYEQTDDGTLLISGSVLGGGGGEATVTWLVQLYDVDPDTRRYTLIREECCRMRIEPIQPYAERTYWPTGPEGVMDAALLVRTPLQTYLLPVWADEEEGKYLRAALLEADGQPVPRSRAPEGDGYALERVPQTIAVRVVDMPSGEELGVYELAVETP